MTCRPLIVAALLLLSAGLAAQVPQQTPPTFRTTTDIVPLTVRILDKSGNPVTDLKASDFTVLEDGKPREILNFFTQTFTPEPGYVSTGVLNRAAPRAGVAPESRRTFLVVLGYGRIQYPTKAVDGVLAFIRERLMPQDLAAVLAFDRATDFTSDHAQLAQMLERYRSQHERIVMEFDEWFLHRRMGLTTLPRAIREDIDAIFTGVPTSRVKPASAVWSTDGKSIGTMRAAVPMLFGMNRAAMLNEKPWDRSQTFSDVQGMADVTHDGMELSMLQSSTLKAYAGIEYLRYLEGEKHMLYLGETGLVLASGGIGSPETSKEDDAKLARRLNDARITLAMVRTTGPPKPNFGPPNGSSLGDLISILGFQQIAEQNGGTYTGVTYADKALEKVDRISRFSYLLGYAPSNPALDGKYRKIEVKVNRKDVVVQYRHGYFAVSEPEPLNLRELISSSRLEAAATFEGGAKDIKLDANAILMPRLGTTHQLRVQISIDATRLAFVDSPTERAARIELRIYVGDDKEKLIGDWSDQLTIPADAAAQAEFVRTGIPYTVRIPLTGMPKHVKVVVYDYGSDLVGTFTLTMK